MRVAAALVFFFAGLAAASAENTLKSLERLRLFGSEYVRVKEWADENGFDARWVKTNEEIRLTNRWCKLNFVADSRRAQVNGMNLMLSLPVVLRRDVPFISVTDLQTTLHPILYPAKNSPSNFIRTICLDAGHGGKDKGKVDKRNYEKKYTLLLAEEVSDLLQAAGLKVVLTRNRDTFIELSERAAIAHRNRADLFVSLHYNSAASDVRGVETYCLTPAGVESSNSGGGKSNDGSFSGNRQNDQNMLLAYSLQRSIVRTLGLEDRGIKRARYEVLREIKMPGVLIEGGFMSNPTEAKKIYDAAFRRKMAQAIVDGILAYKKIVEPQTNAQAN